MELQLPASTTAAATQDPSRVCDLHHSSCNAGSLTHRVRPGIQTRHLRVTRQIHFCCTTVGPPRGTFEMGGVGLGQASPSPVRTHSSSPEGRCTVMSQTGGRAVDREHMCPSTWPPRCS